MKLTNDFNNYNTNFNGVNNDSNNTAENQD